MLLEWPVATTAAAAVAAIKAVLLLPQPLHECSLEATALLCHADPASQAKF